jgi:hypothetical protein
MFSFVGRMCLEVISYLVTCQNNFLRFLNPPSDLDELEHKSGVAREDENLTGLVEIPVEVATRSHVITLDPRQLDQLVTSNSSEITDYGKRQPVV